MRLYKSITVLCLFTIIMAFSTTAHADQVIIEADDLNVRTGPGTHYERSNQVNSNEVYQIIQIDGDWVEIEIDGDSGWVTTEFVTIEEQTDNNNSNSNEDEEVGQTDDQMATTEKTIIISNDNTQIRNGPSVDHEIISFAQKNQEFEVVSENNNWYEVVIDDGTGYIFKRLIDNIKLTPTNHLKNKTIVIDAGHGGYDVGAISENDKYEKSFTLKTTSELSTILTTLGVNVILTRNNDDFIRLMSRPLLANVYEADSFISIHFNSFPESTSVDGIDTYYYSDFDKEFANIIQRELINATDANDRGVHHGNFQVIRQSLQPSLLLELGFMSNPEGEQLLLADTYQRKLAQGITTGLEKYFTK